MPPRRTQVRRVLAATLVLGSMLACGARGAADGPAASGSPTTTTRVQVVVVTSPTCPNEPSTKTCPARRVPGATVEIRSGSTPVAQVTSGPEGSATVQLPSGTYQVLAKATTGPARQPVPATVPVGSTPLTVRVTVDSGLR